MPFIQNPRTGSCTVPLTQQKHEAGCKHKFLHACNITYTPYWVYITGTLRGNLSNCSPWALNKTCSRALPVSWCTVLTCQVSTHCTSQTHSVVAAVKTLSPADTTLWGGCQDCVCVTANSPSKNCYCYRYRCETFNKSSKRGFSTHI